MSISTLPVIDETTPPDTGVVEDGPDRAFFDLALRGLPWHRIVTELNVRGVRKRKGGEWTTDSAKCFWADNRKPDYRAYRNEGRLLPVMHLGMSGHDWAAATEMIRSTGNTVSPTGHRWNAGRLETVFAELATQQENDIRQRALHSRSEGNAYVLGEGDPRLSLTYRIMQTPGLSRREFLWRISYDDYIDPLHAICHRGADWGDVAGVLTDLELSPPEPFDVWNGLLVMRIWEHAALPGDTRDRSHNRKLPSPTRNELAQAASRWAA